MTRTNKRIKQGNTRKIKNNNNTTIVPEGVIPNISCYTSVVVFCVWLVRVAQSLTFCVASCRSLFVLLSFFA